MISNKLEEMPEKIRRFEEFVAAEVADTGRPVKQARTLDVPRGIANFRFFGDLIKTAHTECFETTTASGDRAVPPGRWSSARRRATAVRRPAARRRLRASLATIVRSHGRNGDPGRNRGSARNAHFSSDMTSKRPLSSTSWEW